MVDKKKAKKPTKAKLDKLATVTSGGVSVVFEKGSTRDYVALQIDRIKDKIMSS